MSKPEDPLVVILTKMLKQKEKRLQLQKAAERATRERQKREELKQQQRERQRQLRILTRLKEERKRREKDQRLVQKINQELKEAEAKHRAKLRETYLSYYRKYYQLEEEAEKCFSMLRNSGELTLDPWIWKKIYMKNGMREWPEPYKSKCQFTDIEMTLFVLDPLKSHQAMTWVPKRRI